MNKKTRENLEQFVIDNNEFKYIKTLNILTGVDYNNLIDKSLDLYNYYRSNKVSKKESKIQALYHTSLYAANIIK